MRKWILICSIIAGFVGFVYYKSKRISLDRVKSEVASRLQVGDVPTKINDVLEDMGFEYSYVPDEHRFFAIKREKTFGLVVSERSVQAVILLDENDNKLKEMKFKAFLTGL